MRAGLLAAPLATALVLTSAPAHAQLFDKSEFFGSGLTSDTLNGAAPYGSPIPDNRVYVHGCKSAVGLDADQRNWGKTPGTQLQQNKGQSGSVTLPP